MPQPDVAIHGAGLTGLTLGLALARAGVATAVVDPGLRPGRRDGLMAGLATAHQELQHHHVWRWCGPDAARRYAAEVARGQGHVLALATELGVRVRRRPTATVTSDGHEAFWLRHEARAERLAGLEPEFTDTTGLPMATRPQLILDGQPSFDVVAYRDGLVEAYRDAGGVLADSPVEAGRRVSTTARPQVAGRPVRGLEARMQRMTWSWLSFRAPDPIGPGEPVSRDVFHLDEGGRMVVGVGDELWVGSRRDPGVDWVNRYFERPEITGHWEAATSATFDALPLAGPVGPGAGLVACGFGPWESTLGTAAALQLADAITAGSDDLPWTPRRLPRASAVGRAVWGATRHAMRISAVTPFPRRG
ncbi:FAD-binding oxidoreductase/lyase [Mariniluteicoccus flavus]